MAEVGSGLGGLITAGNSFNGWFMLTMMKGQRTPQSDSRSRSGQGGMVSCSSIMDGGRHKVKLTQNIKMVIQVCQAGVAIGTHLVINKVNHCITPYF